MVTTAYTAYPKPAVSAASRPTTLKSASAAPDPTSSAPPTIETIVAISHCMPGRLPSDISSRPANSGPLPRAMIVPSATPSRSVPAKKPG